MLDEMARRRGFEDYGEYYTFRLVSGLHVILFFISALFAFFPPLRPPSIGMLVFTPALIVFFFVQKYSHLGFGEHYWVVGLVESPLYVGMMVSEITVLVAGFYWTPEKDTGYAIALSVGMVIGGLAGGKLSLDRKTSRVVKCGKCGAGHPMAAVLRALEHDGDFSCPRCHALLTAAVARQLRDAAYPIPPAAALKSRAAPLCSPLARELAARPPPPQPLSQPQQRPTSRVRPFPGWAMCTQCHGTGCCRLCHGTGFPEVGGLNPIPASSRPRSLSRPELQESFNTSSIPSNLDYFHQCLQCGGTGRCPSCAGAGQVKVHRTPAWMDFSDGDELDEDADFDDDFGEDEDLDNDLG